MTSLPDALRPWREWLSWFGPDLAAQVGPMLQRLHPLLGAFRGYGQGGEPELEGLDDLRSRGSYQHLLASEWLLAEDMPDEFLRRAASGEHVFLAPRPRARHADRSIVALFDSGPMQFGAPRLAHIALWILLARRAQQAQAEFRWGALQSPGELLEARTTGDLKTLLFRRTFSTPNAASLTSWRNALDQGRSGGELWAIGPSFDQAELQAAPSFTHRVCLQKDLQGTALDVSLFERGMERGICLPLPEYSAVAPLLRGQFSHGASSRQYTSNARAVALKRPPVFSLDGNRVCVALRDEPGALVFRVPRSKEHVGAPRHLPWSVGCEMLAITCVGKQIGALLSAARELRFWGTSLAKMPHPAQEEFHAPGSTAAWLSLGWMRNKHGQRVWIVDHSRRLLQWDLCPDGTGAGPLGAEHSLQLRAQQVLAMVQLDPNSLAYTYHENGTVWFAQLGMGRDAPAPRPLSRAPSDAAVLFGPGHVIAVRLSQQPAEAWAIGNWPHGLTTEAQLPGDSRAIGLMQDPRNKRTSLITLDRNILRLNFVDGGNEVLYTAPDRIVSCTVCPNTGTIAMLTQRRQLIVFSALTRELRLSVQNSPSHESA